MSNETLTGCSVGAIAVKSIVLVVMLGAAWHAIAQDAKAPYPSMAPLKQYLIANRDAEVALARSAAPDSISRDAEVRVLSRHGYETAIQGKNGFVCLVVRMWAAPFDDSEFWNPKVRAPHCFNAPAARSVLPAYLKRTELVLAGLTKEQVLERMKEEVAKKALRRRKQPRCATCCQSRAT